MISGKQMTGTFTMDFCNENTGIIMGGDWNEKNINKGNKAISRDGGKSWTLIADGKHPGYRSSVRFFPGNCNKVIAVGIPGISMSEDGGNSWTEINSESYYTIRFVNQNFAWLAGSGKMAKITWTP